ncbi:MAG: 3-deoxy-7-phosphoheptulonate synthase [Gammaproteobacteria bacterium]|jgi:3-deoxy-7-phosphoheptulonate synthase|nr:3-deoxy-7-phosphoheptulonate synthase [Gammaproteobacteria bacterium]MBT3859396.1 3-deoxy-7-phosphoheptulonate synthase [Gammaproteobacteria bacterium]MBT3988158.1 3-deoxy-7-phosphoheptulonate synthase [Gammaproteobacteria bacterium]MBT4583377.1 3-deoxy-7-phosphoheptulonate synthase [Gammaproteobacteria bacterium]MBT4658438.1 3-deoxy-7-phosphoheptulonate synthase [Gammaproteobacteria bacterium]
MPDRIKEIDNLHIVGYEELPSPGALKDELVLQGKALETVQSGSQAVKDVLDRKDDRLIVVVGPCSIHSPEEALDYARKLKPLADELSNELLILMRVYFEKPRTTVGWEGLIYDPYLDGTHQIDRGLHIGRQLMLDIAEIGLPIAIEALDLISPQYLQDLVAWTAIGARTTESPTHRKLASGISSSVGFKNNVDGGLMVAVNAIRSAGANNSFISVTEEGKVALFRTEGNPHCHVILRGGKSPNYDAKSVAECEAELLKSGHEENVMIDCSHGNSNKDHEKQIDVLEDIASQIGDGNKSIIGVMLESNLEAGNQPIPDDLADLKYGVSITDACINWGATENALREFAAAIGPALKDRSA